MWTAADRQRRFHDANKIDQRTHFARDRDRILYSTAFHRLAGVTQVVRAGDQEVFHTRQQHTLKVAQVGRRLAERCIVDHPRVAARLGVHPEVVEAACLAHDLGHPPFGHVGEYLLDELTVQNGDPDGFEGNAQTFRILTRLGIRFQECVGLDLTRATLAACLKYPWLRDATDPNKSKKWCAYKADRPAFDFAREFHPHDFKTAEASLMDWADDIAYSVHDLEDFHRAGAINWMEVFTSHDTIVKAAVDRWHGAPQNAQRLLSDAFSRLHDLFLGTYDTLFFETYVGTKDQRFQLRNLTSTLIGRYINAASLVARPDPVSIRKKELSEVLILKQIFRSYIIESPTLKAQQYGQKNILKGLYEVIYSESGKGFPSFLPPKLRYFWEMSEDSQPRFAADCIASLTEREAVGMHGRLFGTSDSSVLDPIVR
ncbi:deoxyguanosinetriphosphate triphosphohydrolase family protein [Rhizobium giardinii]|uniref:deoxyguanosinetriphosphate triphosphohydrolase family protein n=1 Tax=Rhizobium giardinii TaxID=56731 RepID=UPI0039E15C42